jgi:chitodextrinase
MFADINFDRNRIIARHVRRGGDQRQRWINVKLYITQIGDMNLGGELSWTTGRNAVRDVFHEGDIMKRRIIPYGVGVLALTMAVAGTMLTPGVAAADTQAPTAPTSLRVQNLSFTSVTLSWSPSVDDSGWTMYEVEASSPPRSFVRYGSTTPSKTVTGLTPGLTYTASVVAVDGSRNLSAPVSIQFTTPVDSTPPTTPSFLPVATSAGAVDSISWTAATDSSALQYVLRSSGNRIYGTTRTSVTAFELLYLDCVVLPGSTHTLTVEALDVHGNVSGRSRPLTVTFPGLA